MFYLDLRIGINFIVNTTQPIRRKCTLSREGVRVQIFELEIMIKMGY